MSVATDEAQSGKWSELVSGDFILPTITLSIGVVLFAFNAFLVSTALPSVIADLGGGHLISWATSVYLVFAIATGVAAATTMQRIGARRLFIASAIVFMTGTCISAAAPSMPILLVGRALQGIAAGFIDAGCYVLIPRLFPSRLLPKVFGVEAAAWAIAACGGPALSGLLAEHVSWRASFLSSLPLAIAFIALVPVVVRDDEQKEITHSLPWKTLVAIAAAMTLVVVADLAASNWLKTAVLLSGGAVFWLVVMADRRNMPRLLPADAFRLSAPVGLGLWTALLMPVAEASVAVFLVYTLQFLWGYSAFSAGLLSAIMALSWSGTQLLASNVASRRWRLHFIWLGPVFLIAGYLILAAALWWHSPLAMVASQIALGAAFGINWGALSQASMEAAPLSERDVTSGLLPTIMGAGYGIGAALFGVIGNVLGFATLQGDHLRDTMMLIFAIACLPGLLSLATAARMAKLLLKAAR